MSLSEFFHGMFQFRHHPDSFALDRETLWTSMADAIANQLNQPRPVMIISHFTETFLAVQAMVEERGFDHAIVVAPPTNELFENIAAGDEPPVQLALAQTVTSSPLAKSGVDWSIFKRSTVAVMVTERHPLPRHDQAIAKFAKTMDRRVELGHYLSFDDVVVQRCAPPQTVGLLLQMGMGPSELITSDMITRRLNKVLAREGTQIHNEHPADSAEQWYSIHEDQL